jgi:glycosyltransferase involved in cell wall biosynthesis
MKIAFISYEYPPDTHNGGIATYLIHASAMLVNGGHYVEVFAGSTTRSGTEVISTNLIVHRICDTDGLYMFPSKIAVIFKERHLEVNFDVLEVPDRGAFALPILELFPDIPTVVKLHTPGIILRQLSGNSITYLLKQVIRKALNKSPSIEDKERQQARKASMLASPSKSIYDKLKSIWNLKLENVMFFPYPFKPNPYFLQVSESTPSENNGYTTISFIGRLEARKGVLEFARAIPKILSHGDNIQIRFIGKYVSWPRENIGVEAKIKKYIRGFEKSVIFLGDRPYDEIPQLLSETDICIFPSRWESFGLVCLEAMSAGRAVVASSSGGMAEIINSRDVGRLIKPSNKDEMVAVILELVRNPILRQEMGRKARSRVLDEYAYESIIDSQVQCYNMAIKKSKNLL